MPTLLLLFLSLFQDKLIFSRVNIYQMVNLSTAKDNIRLEQIYSTFIKKKSRIDWEELQHTYTLLVIGKNKGGPSGKRVY
jgi:hypothetical protein